MANKATVTKLLNRSDRAVVVEVLSVTDETLLMRMHYMAEGSWTENYRKIRTSIDARVIKNEKLQYKKASSKTFKNVFLTSASSFYRMEDICFATKADTAKASAYLHADPAERIYALDQENAQKAIAAKERRAEKEHANMEDLFRKSPVTLADVLERGKELAPRYMIVKDHIGRCSYCGHENPVEVAHGKRMICPSCGKDVKTIHVKRLTRDWQHDSLWIIVPRIIKSGNARTEVASYYKYTQTVYMDKDTVIECKELARSIGEYGSTSRKRWCNIYDYRTNTWAWTRGKNPHFIQYGLGGCFYGWREDWCEWGYIIPKQYLAYLRDKSDKCKRLSLSFFATNDRYVWTNEANILETSMCSDKVRNAVRVLARNKLTDIADKASVSNGYDKEFNVNANNVREILCLDGKKYKDFLLSDRSFKTLKTLQGKTEGVIYKEPDAEKYRALVRKAIPKNALSAGTSYIIPVKEQNGRFLCYILCMETDMNEITREKWYVKDASNKNTYEKIGRRWYETSGISLEDKGKHLLKEDFEPIIKERVRYIPMSLISCEKSRKHLLQELFTNGMDNADKSILLHEKVSKAGFETFAKDILQLIVHGRTSNHMDYVSKLLDNVHCSKLYHVMMLQKRIFQSIQRKDVTLEQLAYASMISALLPAADYDDIIAMYKARWSSKQDILKILDNGQPLKTTLAYIMSNKIHLHEYFTYIENLKNLRVPLRQKEVFPKDFEKTQVDVARKFSMVKNKERTESMMKIRKALLSSKSVRKYLKSNTKYLIFVPETPFELIQEGKRLHNCLSTYVDKVAKGTTSVFFIRDASAPDAPLYAMEIQNGKIVQIHGVNNSAVEDSEVNRFAEGFAKILNRIHYDPSAALAA